MDNIEDYQLMYSFYELSKDTCNIYYNTLKKHFHADEAEAIIHRDKVVNNELTFHCTPIEVEKHKKE